MQDFRFSESGLVADRGVCNQLRKRAVILDSEDAPDRIKDQEVEGDEETGEQHAGDGENEGKLPGPDFHGSGQLRRADDVFNVLAPEILRMRLWRVDVGDSTPISAQQRQPNFNYEFLYHP